MDLLSISTGYGIITFFFFQSQMKLSEYFEYCYKYKKKEDRNSNIQTENKFSDNYILRRKLKYFKSVIKPSTYEYRSAECLYIYTLTPATYQPCSLQGVLLTYVMGYLILRQVSRLDAFSVYLSHT